MPAMYPTIPRTWPALLLLLPLLLVLGLSAAHSTCAQQVDKARTYTTQFDHDPSKFVHFIGTEHWLLHERVADRVWRSSDDGRTWQPITGVADGEARALVKHPYADTVALIIGADRRHYRTEDAGATWQAVTTPTRPFTLNGNALRFHSTRQRHMLFLGRDCAANDVDCHVAAYYTIDAGSQWILARRYVLDCQWGHANKYFQTPASVDTMFCVEWPYKKGEQRWMSPDDLVATTSTDFYRRSSRTLTFDDGQQSGVMGVGVVDRFMLIAVSLRAGTASSSSMDLYSSLDGVNFANTGFPMETSLKEDAYTVLESSQRSLVLDVFSDNGGMTYYGAEVGNIFTSNSNATYFIRSLANTNRSPFGTSDFERVQGVEGILLANIVSNPDRIGAGEPKLIESRISFNDGGSWGFLQMPTKDAMGNRYGCVVDEGMRATEKCALHLYSVTSPGRNLGSVYSVKGAPGILAGVGNVGDYLLPYDQCDLFVSADGGISWKNVRMGAHKYSIGDSGALIVAANDEAPAEYAFFSHDYGASWDRVKFDASIRIQYLVSDIQSSKFLAIGTDMSTRKIVAIQVDLSQIHDRQCTLDPSNPAASPDYERWRARNINDDLECLMGHYQDFYRRRGDAKCYVGRRKQPTISAAKNCACTDENFECDFNFVKTADGKCIQAGPIVVPVGACQRPDDTFKGSNGWRKIPGDTCEGGLDKAKLMDLKCSENGGPGSPSPSPGKVTARSTNFEGFIAKTHYIPNTTVVLIKDTLGSLWRSADEGATWKKVEYGGEHNFQVVRLHDHVSGRLYLFTNTDKLVYSADSGATFSYIKLPMSPNKMGLDFLDFHPTEPDWLVFVGQTTTGDRRTEAFVSSDNGKTWSSAFDTYVEKCLFAADVKFTSVERDALYCSAYHLKSGNQQLFDHAASTPSGNVLKLYKYDKLGKGGKTVLAERVVEFYVFEKFMAVAVEHALDVDLLISTDGTHFTAAVFPENSRIKFNSFTVLQSTTGSVFLDAFTKLRVGSESGTLYTSNSNGTFYTRSVANTNRNDKGNVDFERMQSMEGIILVNQIGNMDAVLRGEKKLAQTLLTFNDGGRWSAIPAPTKDSTGATIDCRTISAPSGMDPCRLNLRSRTVIKAPGSIFSVSTAPGLMMGVGNVGPYLYDTPSSLNTYLTRDGGRTWAEIRKGPQLYEFGDHGALLVAVNDFDATTNIVYSWDDGVSWETHRFHEKPVRVSQLTIEPTSTSLKFLLVGAVVDPATSVAGETVVIQLDFSELFGRKCVLDPTSATISDFEQWSPTTLNDKECVLGHRTTYWRRKASRKCYIGEDYKPPPSKTTNCECDDDDFECDSFAVRDVTTGKCMLVQRHPDEPDGCKEGTPFTGRSLYRRLPMTTCAGGMDMTTRSDYKCTGKSPTWTPPSTSPVYGDERIFVFDNGLNLNNFDSNVLYFEGHEDVITARDNRGSIWRSTDSGLSWSRFDMSQSVTEMVQNPYSHAHAYFLTSGRGHYYTRDGAHKFDPFPTPLEPTTFGQSLFFHAEEPSWLIFVGQKDCDGSNCHAEAYFTKDNGRNWKSMVKYVRTCAWGRSASFKNIPTSVIFCEVYADQSGDQHDHQIGLRLLRSEDFFSNSVTISDDINAFAIYEQYLVVADIAKDARDKMVLRASIDGFKFVNVELPPKVDASNKGFTILESESGSLFLDTAISVDSGRETGILLISNSDGSSYSISLQHTNRNHRGDVDFEKMLGIDGVFVANQITNPNEVTRGDQKHLRTMMSYDDGATWKTLSAPPVDALGDRYACADKPDECQLHLHLYTERDRVKNEISDSGAVGVMVGIGMVGKSMPYRDRSGGSMPLTGDMFITNDAGVSWREVKKGPHLFEFGDHGGVIVLAHAEDYINHVWFSYDYGTHFTKYQFSNKTEVRASNLLTEPDSTNSHFTLFGTDRAGKTVAVYLDLSANKPRKCSKYDDLSSEGDFELWSLSKLRGACMFGQEVQYYRRKVDHACTIEEAFVNTPTITKTCECTAADYECESGFFRNDENGECIPLSGYQESWGSCDAGSTALRAPYRRIPRSKCVNGVKLDTPTTTSCFAGYTTGAWFAIIVFPIAAVAALTLGLMRYRRRGGNFSEIPGRMQAFIERFRGVRYQPVASDHNTLMDDYA